MGTENLVKRNGKWTVEKQMKLYTLAKKYLGNKNQMPNGDWEIIAEIIDAKSGHSCQSMFYQNVRPDMERKDEVKKDEPKKNETLQLNFDSAKYDFIKMVTENHQMLKKICDELGID